MFGLLRQAKQLYCNYKQLSVLHQPCGKSKNVFSVSDSLFAVMQLSINDLETNGVNLCRYDSSEVALNCGMMLRECLRHEPLARIILFSENFYNFFRYVELSTFDIASDAFASFKVSLHILSLFLDCLYSKFLAFFSPFFSGSPHKTQNNVCRFPGKILRQGELCVYFLFIFK